MIGWCADGNPHRCARGGAALRRLPRLVFTAPAGAGPLQRHTDGVKPRLFAGPGSDPEPDQGLWYSAGDPTCGSVSRCRMEATGNCGQPSRSVYNPPKFGLPVIPM